MDFEEMNKQTEGWWADKIFKENKAHWWEVSPLNAQYSRSRCGLVFHIDLLQTDPSRTMCKICVRSKRRTDAIR